MIVAQIPRVRIFSQEFLKIKDNVIKYIKLDPGRRGAILKIMLVEDVSSYSWQQKKTPHRLIFDIQNPHPKKSGSGKIPVEVEPPEVSSPAPAILPVKLAKKSRRKLRREEKEDAAETRRIKTIMVDAGHGGQDPGAIGKLGTKEKDINLWIAMDLAKALRADGGYEVLLTRHDDTFVPLNERSAYANSEKVDLFISVHCNASLKQGQNGFEVYYLDQDASDSGAKATADFENVIMEMNSASSAKKKELEKILLSMERNEYINESALLCHTVETALGKRVSAESRGVKRANFFVLRGTNMPSILVETAFITNNEEEKKLRKRNFRSAIVDAILTGVQDYSRQLDALTKR